MCEREKESKCARWRHINIIILSFSFGSGEALIF